MRFLLKVLITSIGYLPLVTFADTTKVVGKVTRIVMFDPDNVHSKYAETGKGFAAFYIEGLTGSCGGAEKRVGISTNHPLFNTVFSTMLAAKVSGQPVEIWHFNACTLRNNAWDFSVLVF